MPDLLLELRSEEIPARMQRKAAGDLRKMVTDGLVEAGLTYEGCQEYWTPRRLVLDVRGVTAHSRDVSEEKRGPKLGAPQAAVDGFLRSAGLTDIAQAEIVSDPKKGDFYVARIVRPGRAAEEIVAALIPAVIRDFPWPKSMRWGKASAEPGSLRWVRPLQSIVCTFGPETSEPVVVDFEVDGIRSGNTTWGHRFHSPGAITVRRFDDYVAKLEAAKVVLDAERRKQIILADAQNLAFANGLELVEDDGLLEEVSGLVEWPVVLMGEFEEAYLDIPAEVIRLTIRANQKCFVTRGQSALSNRFVLTSNIEAKDGGKEIVHGNGKVVRARLSDALYFWKTDQGDLPDLAQLDDSAKKFDLKRDAAGKLLPLDQRMARLDHLSVTFHAKLGTQGERVERIRTLAAELAPAVGANADRALRAGTLAKADLTTEVVGEFPELQGSMGRKYALLQSEDTSVAAAIEEHYKPQGPTDRVPSDPVSVSVALADKLDMLVGFWAIDEKPTGSKDPFALRRAALGVIRIVIENGVRLRLADALLRHLLAWLARIDDYALSKPFLDYESSEENGDLKTLVRAAVNSGVASGIVSPSPERVREIMSLEDRGYDPISPREDWINRVDSFTEWVGRVEEFKRGHGDIETLLRIDELGQPFAIWASGLRSDLLAFFHDRLKVYLRDQGARHDLIDAVLAGGSAGPSSPAGPSPRKDREKGDGRDASDPLSPSLRGEGKGEGQRQRNDDLLMIARRVEALGSFLDSEDGKNLLAGTKRAANILAAEEKKKTAIAESVDPVLFRTDDERALFAAIEAAESQAGEAIVREDFAGAMRALSALRQPVDTFFDKVLVNDEDLAVRANRLALLARIRTATGQVADFSRIAG